MRFNCRLFFLVGFLINAFSAVAIDYYWDTTNPPGDVQWTEGTAITGSDILYVNDPLTTTQSISNDGTIELNNGLSNSNDITGAGAINTNSQNIELSGTINNGNSINVDFGGTLDLQSSATITTSADINNNGTINCAATLNGSGSITNNATGTINFNTGTSLVVPLINDGDLTFNNNIGRAAAITNNNNLIVAATIGNGNLNNSVGATLEFATDARTFGVINNEGTFNITGDSSTTQTINNFGTMNFDAALSGTSLNNDGTINLNLNGAVTSIYNNSGTINCNGGSVGGIQNVSTLNIFEPLEITNSNIENYETLNLQNDVIGGIYNSGIGEVNVSGQREISWLSSNGGTINFTITDDTTYDSLNANEADLSAATVQVTSSFTGSPGSDYQWDIISSPVLTYDGDTIVDIPASTANETWSYDFINDNILRLFLVNNAPSPSSFTPLPGVDTQIANVLSVMQNNVTNAGQQALLDAYDSVTTQDQYNYLLNNMQPDTNNTASSTLLALQNIGFNKIEVRMASSSLAKKAKKTRAKKAKKRRVKPTSGVASGDLTPNTAMWLAGFGSLSKQHARGDNQGFRAKILGGMLGFDTKVNNNAVYGIAFGVSNANVYNLENSTFTTRILGYNLMLYGANNFKDNYFAEWILSGVINKNHNNRVFSVNSTDLSTQASYRGALGGGRLNFGKHFKLNKTFELSQVNTIQYVLVHQPSYDETGSVAALHVSTKQNQSILTVGTGLRLGILNNEPWLNGNRELRAMVTYDAISPNQTTTANFIVGSDAFIMTSSPVRWAGRFGIDYSFILAKKLSLQFSYDYEVRSGYYDNLGEIKLRYVF